MPWSDGDNLKQVVEAVEVVGVASVKAGRMRVGGGRDQEVHRSRSRLTSRVDDGCRHLTVARCHGFIQGQRVEGALKHQEASQSLGPGVSLLRDENSEVHFRQCDCAYCQLAFKGCDVCRDDDAGVENRSHLVAHGSRTSWAIASRSTSHAGSAGPPNSSVTSAHCLQVRGAAGTSRALGRPATVMVISSPCSTRRTRSEAFWRSWRNPITSIQRMVAQVLLRYSDGLAAPTARITLCRGNNTGRVSRRCCTVVQH